MGNSTSTINNINNSISDNIVKSIQTVQKNLSENQSLTGKCDPDIIELMSIEYNKCIFDSVVEKDFDSIKDDIVEICSPIISTCKMNNITMNTVVNIRNIQSNLENLKNDIKKTIDNSLNQYSNESTKDEISNLVSLINDNVSNIISDLVEKTKNTQIITLNNVNAQLLSVSNTSNIISSQLKSLKTINDSVTNISNIISQTSDTTNTIFNTAFYLIIIIITCGIIISLISVLQRSDGLKDFFVRISPYLIFVILSSVILATILITKPSYIYFKDNTGKMILNKIKLAEYFTLYLVILAIIIYSIYNIYIYK
jgi:hypothetical protein